MRSIKAQQRLQRIFDSARPANCRSCGMLTALAPNKNGLWVKYELDDNSNPTLEPHVCPVAKAKRIARERLSATMGY